MDAEGVKEIASLGEKAAGPVSFRPEQEPAHVYHVRGEGGGYTRHVAEPRPRGHAASDLTALVAKAAEVAESGPRPELWYSRAGVALFLDGFTRRDRIDLPLPFSPQLERLVQWERARTPLTQADLIFALRTLFRSAVTTDLADLVRRISVTAKSTSNQQRTSASLGREIEARIGDRDSLPDYVTFAAPVFAAGSLAHLQLSVECALDFDPDKSLFLLTPVAGQIEAGVTDAERDLGRSLAELLAVRGVSDGAVGLYYGRP